MFLLKMPYKNLSKIKYYIQKNILNILLLLILFNASKHFIFSENYIRGVLVDYTLLKISFIHIVLVPIIFLFIKNLRSKLFMLFILSIVILTNLLFSKYPMYSLIYLTNFAPIFLILFIFPGKFYISQKLVVFVNCLYILFFLFQFVNRSNVFPYFPFGFYVFKGISPNVDYFSFFGSMYVLPLGNFPHSNVFAAFLSFLNILNLKNRRFLLFSINLFLITILSSFSAILFNFALVLISSSLSKKIKITLFILLIISFYFYSLFGFKSVSVIERVNQLNIFWILLKSNFLFGLGFNNFVPSINIVENIQKRIFILQPIHNIFLLLIVEGGLFFSVVLMYLLTKFRYFLYYSPYLLFILIFGFFDHFLITLQQGFLLLLLTIFLHKSIIINKNV